MASVEFIQKRIEGKKKAIQNLEKKLARIEKAESTNWEVNPYCYSESDKRYCLRELEGERKLLAKYEEDLATEIEKANSRNVPIIVEFLETWKANIYSYYKEDFEAYYKEKESVHQAYEAFNAVYWENEAVKKPLEEAYLNARKALRSKLYGYEEKQEFTNRWGKLDYKYVKVRVGEWEHLPRYVEGRTYEEALAKLDKELEQEKNRKYDFIIERTNKIVGQITDASNLKIGSKSDLNGFIVGTKGTAKVQTVGAGGYNEDIIVNEKHGQCFHFRTLISEVK